LKFEFPDTGEGVTEGQFLEWKIEEGDEVEEDQIVGEAETDKAVVDIPAPADGIVKELKASPGDNVKVGDVIMILNTDADSSGKETSNDSEGSEKAGESKVDGQEASNNDSKKDAVMGGSPSKSSYDHDEGQKEETDNKEASDNDSGEILALPKVRKLAEEKGINLTSLEIEGRITEEDVLEASKSGEVKESEAEPEDEEVKSESSEPETANEEQKDQDMSDVNARPSVRKLARKHDIEISMLDGSGRDSEITKEDVLEAAGETEPKETTEKSEEESKKSETEGVKEENTDRPEIEHEGDVERVEMSGVRKVTAERMAQSKDEAAHVTHIEKADITELVELRESVKSDVDAHLTYLPFIMKACVAALREHPHLNSELDVEHNEIIQKNFYDFNIAVDTQKGLLVPKIENVDGKNMIELAQDIGDKASRAQNGELDREEMEPGTFSITNLGVIGGEAFTPIIYPPQSAIMGIGRIQETAEVVDGEVVPRKTVKLSLSYDHRVVDGAEAARFMKKVVKDLENPRNLIIEM
jgi:pyruvate dehydrogenase E2 component (dihydrolipoamide acetyltransferase)